jgi:hypothetical protein
MGLQLPSTIQKDAPPIAVVPPTPAGLASVAMAVTAATVASTTREEGVQPAENPKDPSWMLPHTGHSDAKLPEKFSWMLEEGRTKKLYAGLDAGVANAQQGGHL